MPWSPVDRSGIAIIEATLQAGLGKTAARTEMDLRNRTFAAETKEVGFTVNFWSKLLDINKPTLQAMLYRRIVTIPEGLLEKVLETKALVTKHFPEAHHPGGMPYIRQLLLERTQTTNDSKLAAVLSLKAGGRMTILRWGRGGQNVSPDSIIEYLTRGNIYLIELLASCLLDDDGGVLYKKFSLMIDAELSALWNKPASYVASVRALLLTYIANNRNHLFLISQINEKDLDFETMVAFSYAPSGEECMRLISALSNA